MKTILSCLLFAAASAEFRIRQPPVQVFDPRLAAPPRPPRPPQLPSYSAQPDSRPAQPPAPQVFQPYQPVLDQQVLNPPQGQSLIEVVEKVRTFVKQNPSLVKQVITDIFPTLVGLMDTNKDGLVSVYELGSLWDAMNPYWSLAGRQIQPKYQFLEALDTDRSKSLSVAELLNIVVYNPDSPTWDVLAGAVFWAGVDSNKDGYMSAQELSQIDPRLSILIAPPLMIGSPADQARAHQSRVADVPQLRAVYNPDQYNVRIAEPQPRGLFLLDEMDRLRNMVKRNKYNAERIVRKVGDDLLRLIDVDMDGFPTTKDLTQIHMVVQKYWERAIQPRSGKPFVSLDRFLQIDFTKDGVLVLPELLNVVLDQPDSAEWDALTAALYFQSVDSDRDGYLTDLELATMPENLKELLDRK